MKTITLFLAMLLQVAPPSSFQQVPRLHVDSPTTTTISLSWAAVLGNPSTPTISYRIFTIDPTTNFWHLLIIVPASTCVANSCKYVDAEATVQPGRSYSFRASAVDENNKEGRLGPIVNAVTPKQ